MSDIAIRIADEADLPAIESFIEDHFVKSEPTLSSYQLEDEIQLPHTDEDDDEFIKECILNGTTFMAHNLQNQLVGVAVAGRIKPNEHVETLEAASVANDRKFIEIMKFLAFIEHRADVCNRLGVPESLHLHIISVRKDDYGNGIGGRLFAAYIENARRNGYLALSVDCTSFFTSKIAKRFGMKLLSTVSYDEYNEYVGEKVFRAREPHTVVRSFGMKLS